MSKYYWQVNNQEECYDLMEKDAIEDDGVLEDAHIACVYEMAEFIKFCNKPNFPAPPAPKESV